MPLFREVVLADGVPGSLYLHSMPGRYEPLEEAWAEIARLSVGTIVCLTPADEVRKRSPDYAAAIDRAAVPCDLRAFPIPDFRAPSDLDAFWRLATETGGRLHRGENVVIHCGGGVGRTGTFATAVLMALGVPSAEAQRTVRAAGSGPEMPGQRWALRKLGNQYAPRPADELHEAPGNSPLATIWSIAKRWAFGKLQHFFGRFIGLVRTFRD